MDRHMFSLVDSKSCGVIEVSGVELLVSGEEEGRLARSFKLQLSRNIKLWCLSRRVAGGGHCCMLYEGVIFECSHYKETVILANITQYIHIP